MQLAGAQLRGLLDPCEGEARAVHTNTLASSSELKSSQGTRFSRRVVGPRAAARSACHGKRNRPDPNSSATPSLNYLSTHERAQRSRSYDAPGIAFASDGIWDRRLFFAL